MNVEELIDKIYRIEFDDYEKAKAEILRRFAELGELAGIHDFQDAEVHEKFKTEIRQGIYIQSAETL